MQHFAPTVAPRVLSSFAFTQEGSTASTVATEPAVTTAVTTPVTAAPADPAQEAMLRMVKALEETAFGQWLREHELLWNALAIAALFAIGFALALGVRVVLGTVIGKIAARPGRQALAEALHASKIVVPLAGIVPLLLISRMLSVLGNAGLLNAVAASPIANLAAAFAVLRGMTVVSRALQVADELYSTRPEVNRPNALRGYRQVAMVAVGLVAGISAVAIAVGKSPVVFLAALGAAGAILGVVFKDVLFSLVANLMLTANDAIRQGDWVEMKQHGIDGRIAEIKTTAVRVQNADGTVHAIPIARFVQEPYLNYRSKYGSPGRRVRRSVRIDVRSVRALDAQDLARLDPAPGMKGVAERARQAAGSAGAVTNLCVYRAFAERFLAANDAIDTSLPVVVSQQEATASGVPVDVLCFIKSAAAPDLASVEGA
ncbi:MAG: mechanosensitive ion channel, partial [Limnohabitans sp.]|nr:mechanosensitive ion channel [Limnohabitans sp.]